MSLLNTEHPIYTELRKIRGIGSKVNFYSGIMDKKRLAKILLKELPDTTKAQAETMMTLHDNLAGRYRVEWGFVSNRAANEIWGRDCIISDYKISGIVSDEFPAIYKEVLRGCNTMMNRHQSLYHVWFELWRMLK